MNDWAVAEFVSRVAERVTTAGEGFVALVDRGAPEVSGFGPLVTAFPPVEPDPDFVLRLGQRLLTAPLAPQEELPEAVSLLDRRVVYGVAAVGSLASAAVVVAIFLRSRASHRAAA